MNKERVNNWLKEVCSGKWSHKDDALVDIGHTAFFNLMGTACDFYLVNNKKKWQDYLLENIAYLDLRKGGKYIDSSVIRKEDLLKDMFEWFDINASYFDIDSSGGLFDHAYYFKRKLLTIKD